MLRTTVCCPHRLWLRSWLAAGVVATALLVGAQPAPADTPLHVWVHYDYLVVNGVSYAPDPAGIQMVVDAYREHGITLHIDPQHTAIPVTVPYLALPSLDPLFCHGIPRGNWVGFYELKAQYFHPVGKHEWHYALFADRSCDRDTASGVSPGVPADDLVVFEGFFAPRNRQFLEPFYTGGTFMHELGHNLGLQHGGSEEVNGKPNYLSVMNYSFQFGIPFAAAPGDTRPVGTRLDYSETALPTLDETNLDERIGLGAGTSDLSAAYSFPPIYVPASGPVDWNGDGVIEPSVSQDIDTRYTLCFPYCAPFRGYDDWSAIKTFLASGPHPPGPPVAEPASARPEISAISPAGGPVTGGTEVTITGDHLAGATSVSIGATPFASFQVVNNHTIVAVTADVSGTLGCGRGAGRSDVQVTAAASTSPATIADTFTYTDVLPHRSAVCVTAISPSFGPTVGGTQVTLTGWGFTGATHVDFDNEASHVSVEAPSFTVVDDSTITVSAPAASSGFDKFAEVFVSTPFDGSRQNLPYDEFSYQGAPPEPPPPSVTGLSVHGGPAAGGTTVTITGSGFTTATAVTFGRFPQPTVVASGLTVVDDSTITVTSPPEYALQTVDVAVFSAGGASRANPADQFSYDLPPPPPPTIISVSPAGGSTAGGDAVTLTGRSLAGTTTLQVGPTLLTGGDFAVVDDNTVTFTAPAEAPGTVDVIARTPVGFSPLGPAATYTYG